MDRYTWSAVCACSNRACNLPPSQPAPLYPTGDKYNMSFDLCFLLHEMSKCSMFVVPGSNRVMPRIEIQIDIL